MLKVHVLYEQMWEQSRYIRLLLPLSHPVNASVLQVSHGTEYASADVVLVERTWVADLTRARAETLIARARRDGACLIHTLDDNLFDSPADGVVRKRPPTEVEMAVRLLAREAAGVIVATEHLQQRMARFNPNLHVVPNALDERLLPPPDAPLAAPPNGPHRKVIGYMGTFTHDADLLMILPALRATLHKYRDTVEFQLIGGAADAAFVQSLAGLPVRVLEIREHQAYPDFMRWLARHANWDVAIAPLDDTPFTRCKSDLKFLDYSALGIVGIYSRTPVYESTVRHLETGYLTDNDTDLWRAAVERLLNDDELRRRLAGNAREYVFSKRILAHCAAQWPEAIESIARK